MKHFTHIETDQNGETATYWFEATELAARASHGEIEEGSRWGVADCNGDTTIIDGDGTPVDGIAPVVWAVLDKHLVRAYRARMANP